MEPNNPEELLGAVARQPVAIAIQANQLSFQLYSGGVLTSNCGTQLDHGVLITGYGTENGTDYWEIKNSWGPYWGESGYIKIARNMTSGSPGQCGVAAMPSYPIKNNPNPPRPPRPRTSSLTPLYCTSCFSVSLGGTDAAPGPCMRWHGSLEQLNMN